MSFSRKIFIAVFITTVLLGTVLVGTSYNYVKRQTSESFASRYSVFSKVIGETLSSLDTNTEALMLNAAQVLSAKNSESGLLSTDELKGMRENLNVTHMFVIDKNGKFIRSTNEDPSLIPNAYSFCDKYKNMIAGTSNFEATPIVHPRPEPKAYKFLFVPSRKKDRLLEVAVRIDFIANTLKKAMGSDSNILSMSLYDPKGTSFGTFNSNEYQFNQTKIELPKTLPAMIDRGSNLAFYTKVASSHPSCCECDLSSRSINGEYYYVLESVIDKKELKAILAKTKTTFIGFGLAIIFVTLLFGRAMVNQLVKNIETAVRRIRNIKIGANISDRIRLKGKDEVTFLTNEFDNLLDSLEQSQAKVIEAEKVQAKIQLATEVAHNIKSPILAIEMMLPTMMRLPEYMQDALKSSVKEIKELAESLKKNADTMSAQSPQENELIFLPTFLQEFVVQKNFEYKDRNGISVIFSTEAIERPFVKIRSVDLKSVLSNIVNNSADSYGGEPGVIEIKLSSSVNNFEIAVSDNGAGIPEEYLKDLGLKKISFKGGDTHGVGLLHAFKVTESWGGKIKIKSRVGLGSKVSIFLPTFAEKEEMNFSSSRRSLEELDVNEL